jgi:hypothetical protein
MRMRETIALVECKTMGLSKNRVAVAGHSKIRHERRKENAAFHNPQMEISSITKFYIKLSESG